MKNWYLLVLMIIAGFLSKLSAQDLYRTHHGDIAISITEHDSIHLLVSNQLNVTLDYETSKVSFRVDLETLRSQIDSIDKKIRLMKGLAIEFTGKLGITVNTKNYSPQRYNMEGLLTSTTPAVTLHGKGSMTCIPAGDNITPSCTLLISLDSDLSTLLLKDLFPNAEEGARIDIRQSLLQKEDE